MLNLIFLIHTALTVALAFALALFTEPFTIAMVDSLTHWPTGTTEAKIIIAYARLTAVPLLMVGAAAFLARISGYSAVRWAALIALTVISLLFAGISFFLFVTPLDNWVLLINLIFVFLYLWIAFFYRETV